MKLDDIDFVILGATKSATTWLRHQLQSDPDIYMPDPELHFFSREFHRGTDWYLEQFSPHPGAKVIGEKSNSYLDTEDAAARLHDALPRARLIVMLRDPVERAYSDYCMCYRRGEVRHDLEQYLDPRRAAGARFLRGSRYDLHLKRILSYFDESSLHVTSYELVATDPQSLLDGVRSHLGLPSRTVAPSARKKVNDRTVEFLPLAVRRGLAPLKPFVSPVRGSKPFETVRSLFAAQVTYPELGEDLRRRMSDYFAPMHETLSSMGYVIGPGQATGGAARPAREEIRAL